MKIEYRVVDVPWAGKWRYRLEKRVSRKFWMGFWERVDSFVSKDQAIAMGEQLLLKNATVVWSGSDRGDK